MSNETAYHLGDSLWDLTDQELKKKEPIPGTRHFIC